MTDIAATLGAQSYCYRGFKDNKDVVAQMEKSGLKSIELWGGHCDWKNPSIFDDVIAVYRDAGIDIPAIGVNSFANNADQERKYFEFCQKAGVKVISCNFPIAAHPQCFETAEKLADEYDVNLALHNHGGHHWLGSKEAMGWLFSVTGPRIGLCLDTAWCIDANLDPVAAVEQFADRLYGLHLKDFTYQGARKPIDVIIGEGILDLKALFNKLKELDYSGYAVLEYEADVDNPAPALTKCVEAVQAAW